MELAMYVIKLALLRSTDKVIQTSLCANQSVTLGSSTRPMETVLRVKLDVLNVQAQQFVVE